MTAWLNQISVRRTLLGIIIIPALAVSPVSAALITDGFDDGDRTSAPGGIDWYAINGLSGGGTQKPVLEVIDDTAGIGAGNALSSEAVGSNSEAVGILGQSVALGANTGDSVQLSFDFRVDGSNNGGDFRFGL
ncbi:unnamed protein product, partial [Ectocarpus sp. 4 AP-2014]